MHRFKYKRGLPGFRLSARLSAARLSSNPEWSVQDPQRPQSIWWHTDATFVGFRLARAFEEQENLKGVRSLVVKGKGSR